MNETALLIFSYCLQASIGMMVMLALGTFLYKDKTFKLSAIVMAVLAVVGVLASLLHLGTPLSAINALSHVGNSWLSNEVLLAAIFAAIAVIYALLILLKKGAGAAKILTYVGALVGLCGVFAMGKLYATTIVPYWQGAATYVTSFTAAIASGAALFVLLGGHELKGEPKKIFGLLAGIAVAIAAAVTVPQMATLALGSKAAFDSAQILSGMTAVLVIEWVLILVGALLFAVGTTEADTEKLALPLTLGGAVALLVGLFIARYVFYIALVSLSVGLI